MVFGKIRADEAFEGVLALAVVSSSMRQSPLRSSNMLANISHDIRRSMCESSEHRGQLAG